MNEQMKETLNMTAQSIGKDLLSGLLQELRLLPDVWVKLSQKKQDDIIERLRKRVDTNVRMAVHLVASEGRTVVAGDLEQITIKDGVKAVCKFSQHAPNLHEMFDAAGKAILLVVANPTDHTGGMDEIKGESDQRAMDLGKEYDPNGDGEGMDEGNVVDAEFTEAPQLGHEPSADEQDEQFEAGYQAAADGQPEANCPIMHGKLCINWVKGHKQWHANQAAEGDPPPLKSMSGEEPNEYGVYTCEPTNTIEFNARNIDLTLKFIELENKEWVWGLDMFLGGSGQSFLPSTVSAPSTSLNAALLESQTWLQNRFSGKPKPEGITSAAFEKLAMFVSNLHNHQFERVSNDQDQSATEEA